MAGRLQERRYPNVPTDIGSKITKYYSNSAGQDDFVLVFDFAFTNG